MAGNRLKLILARQATVAPALEINGTPVTSAVQGVAYTGFTLTLSGGVLPYIVDVSAGTLPSGITFTPSGSTTSTTVEVSGVPTSSGLASGIVFRVTDAVGTQDTLPAFDLNVTPEAEPGQYTATDRASLLAHVATAVAAGVPAIIDISDGGVPEYGSTIIDLTNLDPVGEIHLRGLNFRTATLPGIDFQGSSNFKLTRTKQYRARVVVGTGSDATAGVIRVHSATDIEISDNEISSDTLSAQDYHGYFAATSVVGVFQNGEAVTTNHPTTPGTGFIKTDAPASSASNLCIIGPTNISNPNGGAFGTSLTTGVWWGRTMTGATSGATCTVGTISSNGNFLVGIAGGTTGTAVSAITVTGNYIHDTKQAVAWAGTGCTISNNLFGPCYISFWDLNGDISDTIIKDNRGQDIFAIETDGEPSGTNGPHSSTGGFSQGIIGADDVDIEGNILLLGRGRFNATGMQGGGTGPKMNDMPYNITGSISGTTLTATSVSGSNLRVGHRISSIGSVVVAAGTIVTAFGTGSGGAGTYTLNISQTVASTSSLRGSATNLRWRIRSNIFDVNGSPGIQFASCVDSEISWNTLTMSRDITRGTVPNLYYNDISTGNKAIGNIVPSFGTDTSAVDLSWFLNSNENLSVFATAGSGPGRYEALFTGIGGASPFSNCTLDNAVTMWTPLAGTVADGLGATAYYNFETGVSSYPTYVKPSPTTALGLDSSVVSFNGTNAYLRYTRPANPAPLLTITPDPDVLTIVIQGTLNFADTVDASFVVAGATSDIVLRRLASSSKNRMRFTMRGTDGNGCMTVDTSIPWTTSDGLTVWAIAVRLSTYEVQVLKANSAGVIIDPFPLRTTWTGLALRTTGASAASNFTVAASGATTPTLRAMNLGVFAMNDTYVDINSEAGISKIVAANGKPVAYGAAGATLFGATAAVLLSGVAAAYNGGTSNGGDGGAFAVAGGGTVTDV